MNLALLTVTVAQLLDLGTFVRMVAVHGPASEANPLVAYMLLGLGLPFVAVAKVAGLSVVVAVIVVLAGADFHADGTMPARLWHRRLSAAIVAAAVVAGLVGGWTNAAVLTG